MFSFDIPDHFRLVPRFFVCEAQTTLFGDTVWYGVMVVEVVVYYRWLAILCPPNLSPLFLRVCMCMLTISDGELTWGPMLEVVSDDQEGNRVPSHMDESGQSNGKGGGCLHGGEIW